MSLKYISFLLRVWREEKGEPEPSLADWHAELEHIQSGNCWKFEEVEDLISFLRKSVNEFKPSQEMKSQDMRHKRE